VRKTVIFFTNNTPEVNPAAANFAVAAGVKSCCSRKLPNSCRLAFAQVRQNVAAGPAASEPELTREMIRVIMEV